MQYTLPGTTIEARADDAQALLQSLFVAGGLVLSQVSLLTGLEPHTIQNWVKRGFLSAPQRKKYSQRQVCRIFIINMLRDSLQIERICQLLSYVNGRLDDEGDDIIDDTTLYLHALSLIAKMGDRLASEQGILSSPMVPVLSRFYWEYIRIEGIPQIGRAHV